MDDKKEENKKEQGTSEDAGEGDKPKTTPLIDIANAAAERMEKANEETERLQAVQAERDQRIALGGRAEGGQEIKQEFSEEEKKSRARIKAVGDASGASWAKKYE